MAGTTGISGVGVGIVTAGTLLLYAGLKDMSPLDALRAVAGGSLPGISSGTAAAITAPVAVGSTTGNTETGNPATTRSNIPVGS